ncbi:MAG: cytochrome c-type biogenesis protein [Pseudomonadota bacterium]
MLRCNISDLSIKRPVFLIAAILLIVMTSPAFAVEPDEILDDPALEERAREISRELRCVTCQSQSIDDSNAPLAKDLRLVVRERVVAGDSNDEVIAYVTERYGDYVRLKPELRSDTMLLWLTPLLALGAALLAAFFYFRQLKQPGDDDMEEDLS